MFALKSLFFFGVLLIFSLHSDLPANANKENVKAAPSRSLTKQRLLKELRDIASQELLPCFPFNTTDDEIGVRLLPTENIFEWHFSFTGIKASSFEGGVYHGRIILPRDYPRKAPSIDILTPNGRWEVAKSICLSATHYHQETWDPNWNLRTLVMALRGHMLAYPREIGGILATPEQRRIYALSSQHYSCPHCGMRHSLMLESYDDEQLVTVRKESSELLNRLTRRAFQSNKRPIRGNAESSPLQQAVRRVDRIDRGLIHIILKHVFNFLFSLVFTCFVCLSLKII